MYRYPAFQPPPALIAAPAFLSRLCPSWLPAIVLLVLVLTAYAGKAQAATPLALSDATQRAAVSVWPWLSIATDPGRDWSLEDALAEPGAFVRPSMPAGNLGPEPAAHWLRFSLRLDAPQPQRWWLAIDYPLLDHVEIHLLREGHAATRQHTGNHLPFSQRPAPTRMLVVPLDLQPGAHYEVLMRLETTGPAIAPISLMSTQELMRRESAAQLRQGLAAGFGLCLLLYALARAVASRDPMFLWFAIAAFAGTLFFFVYHGLAAQYLWPGDAGLNRHAALLSMFGILIGGFLFTEHTLAMSQASRLAGRLMHSGAAVSLLGALLLALGWIDYGAATRLLMVLGLLPTLVGLPMAAYRARGGDHAARWIFAGFCFYSVGVATMTVLNAGLAPATGWNLHAFQAGSLLLLGCWIMVMSLRAEEIRHAAEHARSEQARLTQIARTDALTGLLNRRGLHAALEARLAENGTAGRVAAVYLIDLDGFKPVNDQHGHDAGDELLREIGLRLQALAGEDALAARLGGDEFVIVSPWVDGEPQAAALAERLQTATASPFMLASGPCRVGMTMGYAIAPRHGKDSTTLLKRADSAMYAGKQAGRGRCRVFDSPKPAAGSTVQPIASRNA